jgi:hypothetical protein
MILVSRNSFASCLSLFPELMLNGVSHSNCFVENRSLVPEHLTRPGISAMTVVSLGSAFAALLDSKGWIRYGRVHLSCGTEYQFLLEFVSRMND